RRIAWRRHRGLQHAGCRHRLQLRPSAGCAGRRAECRRNNEGVAMHIRFKLILPAVLTLLGAVALALWSTTPNAGLTAGLALAAAIAVGGQWVANERWVHGALRAIRATLAGL